MRALLAQNGVSVVSPDEFSAERGLEAPGEVDETGSSYAENALLKARAYGEWSRMPTIGDDTGLEVSALNGEPGLFTARFAGKGATSQQNMDKLLAAMSGMRDRRARFDPRLVPALGLVIPDGHHVIGEDAAEARILEQRRALIGGKRRRVRNVRKLKRRCLGHCLGRFSLEYFFQSITGGSAASPPPPLTAEFARPRANRRAARPPA